MVKPFILGFDGAKNFLHTGENILRREWVGLGVKVKK